jgi:hypothetical protein
MGYVPNNVTKSPNTAIAKRAGIALLIFFVIDSFGIFHLTFLSAIYIAILVLYGQKDCPEEGVNQRVDKREAVVRNHAYNYGYNENHNRRKHERCPKEEHLQGGKECGTNDVLYRVCLDGTDCEVSLPIHDGREHKKHPAQEKPRNKHGKTCCKFMLFLPKTGFETTHEILAHLYNDHYYKGHFSPSFLLKEQKFTLI